MWSISITAVARFGGLQTLDLGPRSGEFMLLFYADEAKLYVPVERLDLVQRYSSAEGHQPQLDRLGGLGWQKTKAKAKRAMRDMADELVAPLRRTQAWLVAIAFAADTPWQQEFEDGFQYRADTRSGDRNRRRKEGHGRAGADGSFAVRRCWLRQD